MRRINCSNVDTKKTHPRKTKTIMSKLLDHNRRLFYYIIHNAKWKLENEEVIHSALSITEVSNMPFFNMNFAVVVLEPRVSTTLFAGERVSF